MFSKCYGSDTLDSKMWATSNTRGCSFLFAWNSSFILSIKIELKKYRHELVFNFTLKTYYDTRWVLECSGKGGRPGPWSQGSNRAAWVDGRDETLPISLYVSF